VSGSGQCARLGGLGTLPSLTATHHWKDPLIGPIQPFTENRERRTSGRGFLAGMKSRIVGDAVPGRHRPPKTFRGSRRRVKRITLKDNGSLELWLFVAWVVFLLVIVLPWMVRHSH
jgi:hypothetical protein